MIKMSFIIAFFLLGLLSQASLAKSLEEPIAGCTGICSEPNKSVLDQQLIMQKLINNMETNLKTQQEWVQNLVNVASQEKLKNRQTLEAIESRMARLDSVAHKLHEYPGIERNDTFIGGLNERLGGLEKQITEQQQRDGLDKRSALERLEKLEDKLAQLDHQIAVEQFKSNKSDQLPQEPEGRAQAHQGKNTSYLDDLRDRVEVLEKRNAGQVDTVSTLGEISVIKRLYNIEKVLLGQQEIITSNNTFADGLSGIKEQLADQQLKHLSEAAETKERFDAIEKDLADKQLNIESKGSNLTEVLNGLKNQLAGHETKLINGENKQLDSVTKLEKLQDQLTNQQNKVSNHEAAIKLKTKKLWNRLVKFKKLGSKYYYFEWDGNEQLNWTDARDICQDMGGHLASPQNQQEYTFLSWHINDQRKYWLDINDIENEGVFVSSSTGKKANFLKWRQAPDNWFGEEDCVEVAYVLGGKLIGMNDLDCSEEHMYICEKEL